MFDALRSEKPNQPEEKPLLDLAPLPLQHGFEIATAAKPCCYGGIITAPHR
jgi:hypothetical protein